MISPAMLSVEIAVFRMILHTEAAPAVQRKGQIKNFSIGGRSEDFFIILAILKEAFIISAIKIVAIYPYMPYIGTRK